MTTGFKQDFTIESPDLDALLKQSTRWERRVIRPELVKMMNDTGAAVQRKMADEAPIGADSDLFRSIKWTLQDGRPWPRWVTIGPSVLHGIFVALGTKPHFPPIGPTSGLRRWVRLKLGVSDEELDSVTFLVGRKIARSGTQANDYHIRGKDQAMGDVRRVWREAIRRIAVRMARRRG